MNEGIGFLAFLGSLVLIGLAGSVVYLILYSIYEETKTSKHMPQHFMSFLFEILQAGAVIIIILSGIKYLHSKPMHIQNVKYITNNNCNEDEKTTLHYTVGQVETSPVYFSDGTSIQDK